MTTQWGNGVFMFSGKSVALGALMVAAVFVPSMASAATIVNVTTGPGLGLNGTGTAEGESLNTGAAPAGDSGWNNIEFNWYTGTVDTTHNTISGLTALADGDVFILTQAYTGTTAGLSSSTAGFVAESTGISAGVYDFASSVTLAANTEYYIYSDTALNEPLVSTSGGTANFERWRSPSTGNSPDFAEAVGTENLFDLQGTAVPEPATWAMFLVGFGAVGFAMRRPLRKVVIPFA